MSFSLNKVILTGHAAKDAELTKNEQITVVNFTIAVNRSYKTQAGEWVNDVDYLPVRAYSKLAEYLAEKVKSGSRLELTGSIRKKAFKVGEQNRSEIFIELNSKPSAGIHEILAIIMVYKQKNIFLVDTRQTTAKAHKL